MPWRAVACCALAVGAAQAQPVPDPFSYRGVPLQSSELQFRTMLPDFRCGPAQPTERVRADRACVARNVEGLSYAGKTASDVQAEFIGDGMCSVLVIFRLQQVTVDELLTALQRHFGTPTWAWQPANPGRIAPVGDKPVRTPPATRASWVWEGEASYVRMDERGRLLRIEYSSEACDQAREQRRKAGPKPAPVRRPM